MFQNTCTKCGQPFDTKNPNRVVCPNCLYPGRDAAGGYSATPQYSQQPRPQYGDRPAYTGDRPARPPYGDRPAYPPREGGGNYPPREYPPREGGYAPRPAYGDRPAYGAPRPQYGDRPAYPPREGGGYPPREYPPREGGGYPPREYPPREGGGYPPREYPPREGGYAPRPGGYGGGGAPRPGGFGGPRPFGPRPGGGRPGGGFRPGGGRPGGRPGGPGRGAPKKLLIPKEVLLELEKLYTPLLPLPNPDVHEVLAEKLNIEPSKAFFGINLVRMKMKLPKLEYPKRKLAVTPDQLMAIEAMYTPYMTMATPPIGIHKILAKQLKIDEWRVHVAIGLIRKAKNMSRWNTEREDLPEQMKAHLASLDTPETEPEKPSKPKAKKTKAAETAEVDAELDAEPETPLVSEAAAPVETSEETPAPKKRGRPKKVLAEEA